MPTIKLKSKEGESPVVLTVGDENKIAIDEKCCCGDCCAEVVAEFTTDKDNPDWDLTIYAGVRIDTADRWVLQEGGGVSGCKRTIGYPRDYQSGDVVNHFMVGLAPFHDPYTCIGHMKLIAYCTSESYGGRG